MLVDCNAVANSDTDMIFVIPVILDENTNQPTDFISVRVRILAGVNILYEQEVDYRYVHDGKLTIAFNHPQYLEGLTAVLRVTDVGDEISEVTVPVRFQKPVPLRKRILPRVSQPDHDKGS